MSEHDSLHKYDEHIAKYAKQEATMSEPIKLPEALRLADALSGVMYSADDVVKAAAELRRLHAENERLRAQVADFHAMWEVNSKGFAKVEAERDALRVELAAMTKRATAAEDYAEHMLTEARKTADVMAQAEAECDALRAALEEIKDLALTFSEVNSSVVPILDVMGILSAALKEAK